MPNLNPDRRTAELEAPVRTQGGYSLRRAPWQTIGYSLWLDVDGESTLVTDDLPASAIEDFDVYVDEAEEEMRVLAAAEGITLRSRS